MVTRPLLASAALATLLGGCAASGAAPGNISIAGSTTVVRYPAGGRALAPPAEGPSLRPGPDIDGSFVAGKVAVVHFWGSWCGPCRREQPVFVSVSQSYRARGVQFLGVNTRRDQKAAALAFWDEFGVTYPSIYDPASRIAYAWKVRVMPATFVVDRDGRIAAAFVGAADDRATLTAILDEELARA